MCDLFTLSRSLSFTCASLLLMLYTTDVHSNGAAGVQEAVDALKTAPYKTYEFAIPPGPLPQVLNQLAQQSHTPLLFPFDAIKDLDGRAVLGKLSLSQALITALQDTGFTAKLNTSGVIELKALPAEQEFRAPASKRTAKTPRLIEEVLITGYRASLKTSLIIKSESIAFKEVITAEEIGKFPDTNVAESLQRLTGVAIERNGGEGQFITVRGFGPEFNTTVINGRTMATDNQERGFSFDTLPAELITSAELFKTTPAHLPSGSLAAIVNLSTPRPFDLANEKPQLITSLETSYSGNAQSFTPHLFTLASHTWYSGNQTVGLLGALVNSKREWLHQGYTSEGYRNASEVRLLNPDMSTVSTLNNLFVPRSFRLYQTSETREQNTGILAAQVAWDKNTSQFLQISFDGLHSDYSVTSKTTAIQAYFEDTFTELVVDSNNTAINFSRAGNETLNSLSETARDELGGTAQGIDHVRIDNYRPTKNTLAAMNIEWTTPTYTSLWDYSYSHAQNESSGNPFSAQGLNSESDTTWRWQDPNNPPHYITPQATDKRKDIYAHFVGRFGGNSYDRIQELRWDNTWDINNSRLNMLSAGVFSHRRNKNYTSFEIPYPRNCAYCGRFAAFSSDTLVELNIRPHELFRPVNIDSSFAGGFSGIFPQTWFDYDLETVASILESEEFIASTGGNASNIRDRLGITDSFGGVGFDAIALDRASYRVREQITDAYISGELGGSIWQQPWAVVLGLRYSHTDTHVLGTQADISGIERALDDDQLNINFAPEHTTSAKHDYHSWLPSALLRYNAGDHWTLRLAANKTVTRPNLVSLGEQMSVVPRAGSASIFIGNPKLEPYESENMDVALEWTPSSQGFIGLNLFYKAIDQFESTTTSNVVIDGFVLNQSQRTNQESADATGIELSFLHTWQSGFGIQANASHIRSNAEYFTLENQDVTETFAIEGLSPNTSNIIVFYETDRLSLRASYNWRDRYLRAITGAQSQPENANAYGQLDVSARIYLREHWELFFNAININEERSHTYSEYENRTIKIEDTGMRLGLGVKYHYH